MTDKQIIIDYENICENYSKEVGCYNTFDGSCIKEQCFTYRLLQLLKAKEQECEELKFTIKHTGLLDLMNENVKLKQALDKIEEYIQKSIKSNVIAEEEKEKSKRSECPYGGIDWGWCGEDCE